MEDDDLTPEQFRAALAAGEPATINPGPRPRLLLGQMPGVKIFSGAGGGVSIQAPSVSISPISTQLASLLSE